MSEEVADLAEAASQLVEADPENRRAFADLATALSEAGAAGAIGAVGVGVVGVGAVGGSLSLPVLVAIAADLLVGRLRTQSRAVVLPREEQGLWEEAGASFADDGTATDMVRASAAFADLVARSVDGDGAVAEYLGVDRSRISQRLAAKSLYAFTYDDARRFPAWQFVDGRTLPGLKQVLAVLDGDLHPLVVDHWFVTPSVDLDIGGTPVSPASWLSTGGAIEPVVDLAADL